MKQKIKLKKKVNPWQTHLKKVYTEMKAKDKTVMFRDAMKKAKKTYSCKKK